MFARWFVILGIVSMARVSAAMEPPQLERAIGIVNQYCIDCHGNSEPEGDLNLSDFVNKDTAQVSMARQRATWDKIRLRVQQGDMPPKKSEPLDMRSVGAWSIAITRWSIRSPMTWPPTNTSLIALYLELFAARHFAIEANKPYVVDVVKHPREQRSGCCQTSALVT